MNGCYFCISVFILSRGESLLCDTAWWGVTNYTIPSQPFKAQPTSSTPLCREREREREREKEREKEREREKEEWKERERETKHAHQQS